MIHVYVSVAACSSESDQTVQLAVFHVVRAVFSYRVIANYAKKVLRVVSQPMTVAVPVFGQLRRCRMQTRRLS